MKRRRHRGLGQASNPSIPTCANYDYTHNIPQGVLVFGGGAALLTGVVGAVVSEDNRAAFLLTAGLGLIAGIGGLFWAATDLFPECTGPGLPWLGQFSVNPDQTTPVGELASFNTPAGPAAQPYQATPGQPQYTTGS